MYLITHDDVDTADPDVLEMAEWAVEHIGWSESLVNVIVTNEWVMTIGEHRATQEIDLAWASYEEDPAHD